MNNVLDGVKAYEHLLSIRYEIMLVRKGHIVNIKLGFSKEDCFHLMGLQYLKDLSSLSIARDKVFDKILNETIKVSTIESSSFYTKITNRVNLFPLLEMLIDSNETIFKYDRGKNAVSFITAHYLMQNKHQDNDIYVFLDSSDGEHYFCKSFFPKEKMDYSKDQALWKMVYKKKIDTNSGLEVVLYDNRQILR